MEKDIVPELLENLLKEFEESLQKNEEIKKALEILISKKANYRNANEFAEEVGNVLVNCFKNNISFFIQIIKSLKFYIFIFY